MAEQGNLSFFIPHLGCPHRCSFCDQTNISGQVRPPSPEQVALQCAAAYHSTSAERRARMEIAFFGGSFTCLPRGLMMKYLQAASEFCAEDGFCGIRLSTRPDAVDPELVALLKEYHVTAIELGAQSMDDHVLRKNRRGHTRSHIIAASRMIQCAQIELGLQMMIGLAGESRDSCFRTARALAALNPSTMRIYPVVVLPGTLLARWYQEGSYSPPDFWETVDDCALLLEYFQKKRIRVIRMGLHSQAQLQQSMLAGVYHPAFRELCESRLFLKKEMSLLLGKPPGRYVLMVNPSDCSKAIGHAAQNRKALRDCGYQMCIKQNKNCRRGDLILLPEDTL